MTEQAAEIVEEQTLSTDEVQKTESNETNLTESAPVEAEKLVPQDVIEQRIKKQTSKIYAEKQRADRAEAELQRIREEALKPAKKTPTLEEFDDDEQAYSAALIQHQVAEALEAERRKEATTYQQAEAARVQSTFNERVAAYPKADFDEVASSIPTLPPGVVEALMEDEDGPDLIYHIGKDEDLGDKLSKMTPSKALKELGRISERMNAKTQTRTSSAPEPITPLGPGGSIEPKPRGAPGARFD